MWEEVRELGVLLGKKVVTEIKPFEVLYEAEDRHQDYYEVNSQGGYCTTVIDPKLGKFRNIFAHMLKPDLG